mgnify:CR=1 FL=1
MNKHYELTTQPRLGGDPGDGTDAVVLNRIIRCYNHGLEYEADPRQVEKLLAECGLTGANPVATPGQRLSFNEVEKDNDLEQFRVAALRGAAARADYLAAGRIDCQFAAKDICRWMSKPAENSWNALKRFCRYLAVLPRLVCT